MHQKIEEICNVVGQIESMLVPGKNEKAVQTMPLPEAIGVMKTSKNKEATKKFVEWYTSEEMQKELNATNSEIPTRNSVLEELINEDTIQNSGAMLEEAKINIPQISNSRDDAWICQRIIKILYSIVIEFELKTKHESKALNEFCFRVFCFIKTKAQYNGFGLPKDICLKFFLKMYIIM